MGTKHNNFRTRTSTMISCKRDLVGHFYKWSSINKQQHVGTCSTITLGRYTRATLNTISCNPDSKWPWRSRSRTLVFNTSQENLKMHIWCKFDDSSSNLFQVIAWTSQISENSESNGQNDLDGQGHCPLFSIPDKSILWCMYGANLVIPAQIRDELLRGQSEFPRIPSPNDQNDIEGQCQWPPIFNRGIPRVFQDACLVHIWWFQPK